MVCSVLSICFHFFPLLHALNAPFLSLLHARSLALALCQIHHAGEKSRSVNTRVHPEVNDSSRTAHNIHSRALSLSRSLSHCSLLASHARSQHPARGCVQVHRMHSTGEAREVLPEGEREGRQPNRRPVIIFGSSRFAPFLRNLQRVRGIL